MKRRKRMLEDLEHDIREHIERETQDNIARGMPPEEAKYTALRKFGNVARVQEETREVWASVWFDQLVQDVRYGFRLLRRSPLFALVAIFTLAIGIGANTAIFTVVRAILLQPLPYPNSDRLAIIWSGLGDELRAPASEYELLQLRERSRLFDQIGGIWVRNSVVPGEGRPEQVKLGVVTDNFLTLLCGKPALGRLFTPRDVLADKQDTMIISFGLWQRRFGGDPGIVGRPLRAGDGEVTIIGVLPQDFRLIFPDGSSVPPSVDLYTPLGFASATPDGPSYLRTIGLLRAGANFSQAQSEFGEIAAQLRRTVPSFDDQKLSLHVARLQDDDVRNVRRTLLLLFGGVAFVLLIACANVANLLLARSSYRLRETTVRLAIGAPRSRIIRQLLTESIVLGLTGGVAAIGVGWLALRGLLALRPESLLRLGSIQLNPAVFAYTLGISLLAGIIFGIAPAFSASRGDLRDTLKGGGRIAGTGGKLSRTALIAAEVALSFTLLVGTGLLVRTFLAVLNVNPGFRPDHVLTFTTSPGDYNFVHKLQQQLLTIPGVQSASIVSHLPLDDSYPNWYDTYYPEGAPPSEQNTLQADDRSILPGYFQTIGATLIQGRDFTDADDAARQHVAIIDDALAQQTWPGQDPLGRRLNISDSPKGFYQFERGWVVVVGVVKHVQYHSLTTMVRPQIYVPFQLAPRPVSFVLRANAPVSSLAGPIRAAVSQVDSSAPVARLITLDELVKQARAQNKFAAFLAAALAGTALLLACIGIAGVTAFSIAQRTGEIGIRMALGASPGEIVRMVLGQNLRPVIGGLLVGLCVSFAVTPLMQTLLFGVEPGDPLTFVSISAFLLLVGILACYLPALRATRIEPIIALRYE
ncbi:MAG: ABC transporter permease [Candidatus Acidiferrales bacterium]